MAIYVAERRQSITSSSMEEAVEQVTQNEEDDGINTDESSNTSLDDEDTNDALQDAKEVDNETEESIVGDEGSVTTNNRYNLRQRDKVNYRSMHRYGEA